MVRVGLGVGLMVGGTIEMTVAGVAMVLSGGLFTPLTAVAFFTGGTPVAGGYAFATTPC